MGFLKFIFIVIVIYYAFKLISRYVLPYLLSIFLKKAQDQMMGRANKDAYEKNKKKEGKVSVGYTKESKSKANKDELGEYVDFEEVDE